jgi:hypothetical protein
MRSRLPERLAGLLVAALMALPAAAQEDGWDVAKLMQELGQVKRTQARFVERKYMKVLKAPLESSGTLTYAAPDRLEKRTLKPKPELLTIAGDSLAVEMQGKRRTLRLQDYPVLWAFVESIRATLGGDQATLERFYAAEVEGGPARWQLYLVPRERSMRQVISQIRIGGGNARIELIEVQETKGDRSVMRIVEESR